MTRGTKLICTHSKFSSAVAAHYRMTPKLGETYTVRSVTMNPSPDCQRNEPSVLLDELYNPRHPRLPGVELGFSLRRFTHVVDVSQPDV